MRDFDRAAQACFDGNAQAPTWRKRGGSEGFCVRDTKVVVHNHRWARIAVPKMGWVKFKLSCPLPVGKLVIVTGVSGSGKSSLAFDTIYAEGQRRYVESLSAYARQFLERMEKPDVDRIDGISPAIAIRQQLAAWKVALLAQTEPPAAAFLLHVLEVKSLEVTAHPVLVDPECPACRGRR